MSQQALVMRSTGSWYELLTADKVMLKARLRGKFKQAGLKVTNPIAVGDYVEFEPENNAEQSVVITRILPRENYILRKSVHKVGHSHLIASNLDQAVLVVTLAFPRTSLGFIDRFLVSSEAFRIPTVLVFNKIDLMDEELREYFEVLAEMYARSGYPSLGVSALQGIGIEEFKALLANKKTLIAGHSGVGKSSLVNCIAPELTLRTSEVSAFANKGVHTTTFAEMFEIEKNTFLIDTPGIKELGLAEIKKEEISHYFPEMRGLLGQCKYGNCLHLREPGCAVIKAVDNAQIALTRYESYLSMLEGGDNRR